jgi:hypothetical protein
MRMMKLDSASGLPNGEPGNATSGHESVAWPASAPTKSCGALCSFSSNFSSATLCSNASMLVPSCKSIIRHKANARLVVDGIEHKPVAYGVKFRASLKHRKCVFVFGNHEHLIILVDRPHAREVTKVGVVLVHVLVEPLDVHPGLELGRRPWESPPPKAIATCASARDLRVQPM